MNFNFDRQLVLYFFKLPILLMLIVFLNACGKPMPEIDGIDMGSWKDDKNGCQKVRYAKFEQFSAQKNKLLALSETNIVKLLGTPDVNELSDRNQKLYYYLLEPGPTCAGHDSSTQAQRLAIRFNAMGLAKEVRIEQHYSETTRPAQ